MRKRTIIFMIYIICLLLPTFTYGAIPASERAAIIAVYNATDGENWWDNYGWKDGTLEADGFAQAGTEGDWYGVTVANDHVIYLDLWCNGLYGPLPPELGDLTYLQYLDLSYNEFNDSLPTTLGNLTKLVYLDICFSYITGSIPKELGNLTNLEGIDLSDNLLTGSIPPELGNLLKLTDMYIIYNDLSGSIPKEFGNLTNLDCLWLEGNKLTGSIPAEFQNLSKLRYLWLQVNKLSGSIPKELGNLSQLTYICLAENLLTGSIPPELGNLTNLQKLSLGENKLSGPLPSQLGNLSSLQWATMWGNNLVGEIPASFKNLSNMISGRSNFSYNGLYTNDPEVKTFISDKAVNWEISQTIAPTGINAVSNSTSSVTLSWTAIPYTAQTGGYQIFYSTTSGGPWTLSGTTADKSVDTFDVTGLSPGTTYYFVINTKTDSHINNPKNTVVSNYSEEASAVTESVIGSYSLSVQSLPGTGAAISVSPVDDKGNASGTTNFTRVYTEGTIVTLTAPTSHSGDTFSKWTIDGVDNSNRTIQVTMDKNHTVVASYQVQYTLTVNSLPGSGVTVTVSANGNSSSKTTNFTQTYNDGTAVTLTAPAESNGNVFSMWTIDGTDKTGQTIQVTMNRNITVTAVYEEGTPTYTLSVESTHSSGAPITVSPADINDNASGTTTFKRYYREGTVVSLTAPAEHIGQKFARWHLDGVEKTNSLTMEVTMDEAHKAKAYYVTADRPGLVLSRMQFNFGYIIGEEAPPAQALRVTINNAPTAQVDWTVEADASWLQMDPATGTGTTEVSVSINPAGLSEGKYNGTITVTAPDADNSPQYANVVLTIYASNSTSSPIGEFVTPADGASVYNSVPLTGWVVDDIGVERVGIYRKEGQNLKFIGDAVFVEGARPDLEELYPDYPKNYQAGWGYMLLTNFLPNGGNGTYTLHAVAVDVEGNSVTLGTKTITCDNNNAVTPFGAIDTPLQGGTASGSRYINWGWVLTPQPNSIPTDGSTIDVYIDSVNIGHPRYNIYREDIATAFPGYANSDGAVGYFTLDTTAYEDGVHTIFWIAADDAGNSDGIGSRYFTIDNSQSADSREQSTTTGGNHSWLPGDSWIPDLSLVPINAKPIWIKRGYNTNTETKELSPDAAGNITLEITELERVVLFVGASCTGYLDTNGQLNSLPIGSTMDVENGIFYWQPGHGFVGEYPMVFIKTGPDGDMTKTSVTIRITPKFTPFNDRKRSK